MLRLTPVLEPFWIYVRNPTQTGRARKGHSVDSDTAGSRHTVLRSLSWLFSGKTGWSLLWVKMTACGSSFHHISSAIPAGRTLVFIPSKGQKWISLACLGCNVRPEQILWLYLGQVLAFLGSGRKVGDTSEPHNPNRVGEGLLSIEGGIDARQTEIQGNSAQPNRHSCLPPRPPLHDTSLDNHSTQEARKVGFQPNSSPLSETLRFSKSSGEENRKQACFSHSEEAS